MTRALLAALLLGLPLGACGKVGPPRQPGPREAITYPRLYPAFDIPAPTLPAPSGNAAGTAVAPATTTPAARAPR